MLFGSRITGPIILLGSGYVGWRWWQNGTQGLTGFVVLALMVAAFRSMGQVSAYRSWSTNWQAMGQGGDGQSGWRFKPQWVVLLLCVLAALALLFYASRPDAEPIARRLLGYWVIGGGALAVLLILGRAILRLRRAGLRRPTVAMVAINRPIMAVPSVKASYRRLPHYCQTLLQGRP